MMNMVDSLSFEEFSFHVEKQFAETGASYFVNKPQIVPIFQFLEQSGNAVDSRQFIESQGISLREQSFANLCFYSC